jgi:hypothetical protein
MERQAASALATSSGGRWSATCRIATRLPHPSSATPDSPGGEVGLWVTHARGDEFHVVE